MDLGPEGGDKGGQIVVSGTPAEVAEIPPATRVGISSRCWRSIRQKPWRFEGGVQGVGDGRGVACVVACLGVYVEVLRSAYNC